MLGRITFPPGAGKSATCCPVFTSIHLSATALLTKLARTRNEVTAISDARAAATKLLWTNDSALEHATTSRMTAPTRRYRQTRRCNSTPELVAPGKVSVSFFMASLSRSELGHERPKDHGRAESVYPPITDIRRSAHVGIWPPVYESALFKTMGQACSIFTSRLTPAIELKRRRSARNAIHNARPQRPNKRDAPAGSIYSTANLGGGALIWIKPTRGST